MTDPARRIVFQGELGANSHIACLEVYPEFEPVPADTFEDAFATVARGEARYAMIPIENSSPGASPTSTTSCRSPGSTSSASTSCASATSSSSARA